MYFHFHFDLWSGMTLDCYIFINHKVRATSGAEVAITRRSFWISNCGGSTCPSVIKTRPPAVDWSDLRKLLINGSGGLRGVWVGGLRRTHRPPALRHPLKCQTVGKQLSSIMRVVPRHPCINYGLRCL